MNFKTVRRPRRLASRVATVTTLAAASTLAAFAVGSGGIANADPVSELIQAHAANVAATGPSCAELGLSDVAVAVRSLAPEDIAGLLPCRDVAGSMGSSGSEGGGSSFGSNNLGPDNTGSYNTGSNNTGSQNVGSANTGSANVGSANTGSGNVGSANTGSGNVGIANTGSTNVGSANTGSSNTGSGNTGSLVTGVGSVGVGSLAI
ncbi:pentapeptide repeat-containing protein [Rhodococcus kronopolitis]|uniref:Pentapeptide repeat-containing protein n=1 Tax=Rhodococcus kronopolitis TaxID=1460226 RepID=A0ABV9FVU2_9NOCA